MSLEHSEHVSTSEGVQGVDSFARVREAFGTFSTIVSGAVYMEPGRSESDEGHIVITTTSQPSRGLTGDPQKDRAVIDFNISPDNARELLESLQIALSKYDDTVSES